METMNPNQMAAEEIKKWGRVKVGMFASTLDAMDRSQNIELDQIEQHNKTMNQATREMLGQNSETPGMTEEEMQRNLNLGDQIHNHYPPQGMTPEQVQQMIAASRGNQQQTQSPISQPNVLKLPWWAKVALILGTGGGLTAAGFAAYTAFKPNVDTSNQYSIRLTEDEKL